MEANTIGKEFLSDCSVDGKIYAIPYSAIKSPRYCIVTRTELADKYAPDGLETLEDYGLFLKKIKEHERDRYPGFVISDHIFRSYLKGNGYYSNQDDFIYFKWDENGDNPYMLEQTQEFQNAYQLLRDWKEKGYVVPNNAKQKMHGIADGIIASYHVPMEEIDNLFAYGPGMQVQFKVLPLYMESTALLNTSARGTAISENCKNPERVLMFIEWIHSSQKSYDLFTYGVEGKNYILQDGKLSFPKGEVQSLDAWKNYGAGFFQDFRYLRIVPDVDPDFMQTYQSSSLKNIKTYGELQEQHPSISLDRLIKGNDPMRGIVTVYLQNFKTFTQSIDLGNFRMSAEELREKQKEAGIDKVLELYRTLGFSN
jgi:putative aldouronate transport system substrate-binding protein